MTKKDSPSSELLRKLLRYEPDSAESAFAAYCAAAKKYHGEFSRTE